MMTKRSVAGRWGIVLGAALGIAIFSSCASDPEPELLLDATAATDQAIAASVCAWWDRLIGVVLPLDAIRCDLIQGSDGFWRAVAELYMRPRGLTISADFLEHSLLDNPGPIVNHPGAVKKLPQAAELQAFIHSLGVGHYDNLHARLEFRADNDLFAAFEHADVYITGDRTVTGAHFQVSVHDDYTFHAQGIEIEHLLETVGANAAALTQFAGAIHRFSTTTNFSLSATYANPCAGAGNGLYCGSSTQGGFHGGQNPDTLFRCQGHLTVKETTCSAGCVIAPPGVADFCRAADPCAHASNGEYCFNSTQGGFGGDGLQNSLYTCSGGHTARREGCTGSCVIAPFGTQDHCSGSSCSGALSCGGHCCSASAQFCGRNGACCDGTTCSANCPC